MNCIVTITEQDLKLLQDKFSLFHPDLNFTSLQSLKTSINLHSGAKKYDFSEVLGVTYGYIDGVEKFYFYGDGYGLSQIFENKRVYG